LRAQDIHKIVDVFTRRFDVPGFASKAKAIEYEEYLKRVELAKNVQAGHAEETPMRLDTPGKRALWNNLGRAS